MLADFGRLQLQLDLLGIDPEVGGTMCRLVRAVAIVPSTSEDLYLTFGKMYLTIFPGEVYGT